MSLAENEPSAAINPTGPPKVTDEVVHDEEKQRDITTKHGDLGAQWLEDYHGNKREITDEDNRKVRNRVSEA